MAGVKMLFGILDRLIAIALHNSGRAFVRAYCGQARGVDARGRSSRLDELPCCSDMAASSASEIGLCKASRVFRLQCLVIVEGRKRRGLRVALHCRESGVAAPAVIWVRATIQLQNRLPGPRKCHARWDCRTTIYLIELAVEPLWSWPDSF